MRMEKILRERTQNNLPMRQKKTRKAGQGRQTEKVKNSSNKGNVLASAGGKKKCLPKTADNTP